MDPCSFSMLYIFIENIISPELHLPINIKNVVMFKKSIKKNLNKYFESKKKKYLFLESELKGEVPNRSDNMNVLKL